MAVKTIADLEQALDESMAWRRIELHALRGEIAKAEKNFPGRPLTRVLARSGVAILYAHWEGYVKDSCQTYVDYVARRRLLYRELNDGFLAVSVSALLKRLDSGNDAAKSDLIDLIRRPENARAKVPKNHIVDTKSNLRSSVLCEILSSIGFAVDKFDTSRNLIDLSLCDARNSIAHGRDHYPTPGSFEDLHAEVLELMERIHGLIIEAARLRTYRV
ncbi:MAE_28990/MAE_18760 family HEPN-like nuclease [Amycolatopsis kentuckyensis]|uniref:MAE_28990/MAE_18760 family HEPN-like nuclease n=1 Tax=Amycolatopsis kentuckyensis TaxID=218823 RepID=UPI0033653675